MDVVEHDHERAFARRGLEEPPDRPVRLLGAAASATPRSCETRRHTTSWCSSPVEHGADLRLHDVGASKSAIPAACFTISSTGQYVMPSPYGRHRPRSTLAPRRAREELLDQARLPDARPSRAPSTAGRRGRRRRVELLEQQSQLPFRPTIGESSRGAAGGASPTDEAGTPAPRPPCPSARAAPPARQRRRHGPAGMSARRSAPRRASRPARAGPRRSRRRRSRGSAAELPVTTSPVLTPIRTCERDAMSRSSSLFSGIEASRMSAAARTALSASSSCTTGIPNTAITASPMNFSTFPHGVRSRPSSSSKYRDITRRSASGSRRSPRAVEP